MKGQAGTPFGKKSVAGGWKYDKLEGWWSCPGYQTELLGFQFQFAQGTTLPYLDGPSMTGGDSSAHAGFNSRGELPLLHKILNVTTGLKARCSAHSAGQALADVLRKGNLQLLQILDLSSNSIGDKGAEALADALREGNFQSLQTLDIRHNLIGDQGVRAVADALRKGDFQSLQKLDLSSNNIGDKGAEALADALREGNFQSLQTLDIRHNLIGDQGVRAVADALRKGDFQSLQKLDLHSNRIGDKGAEALADVLREGNFQSLQTLDIGVNHIRDQGVRAVAGALRKGNFESLQKLDLSGNFLGDEGAEALADTLREGNFQSLQTLGIGYNLIGDQGVRAVAGALRKGDFQSLQKLDLIYNFFEDKGAQALADALREGNFQSLQTLDIGLNRIGDKGALALAHSLSEGNCNSLQKLNMCGNHIGLEGIEAFYYASKSHPALVENLVKDTNSEISWLKYKGQKEKHVATTFSNVSLQGCEELGNKDEGDAKAVEGHLLGKTGCVEVGNIDEEKEIVEIPKKEHLLGESDHMEVGNEQKWKARAVLPMEEYLLGKFDPEYDHLRLDVQSLGWRSFKEKFNPDKILCLYKIYDLSEVIQLMFFHLEGMASLVGVGVPFANVLIDIKLKIHISIEEGSETAWRDLWINPDHKSFLPIIFKRQKNILQKTSSVTMALSTGDDVAGMDWLNQLERLVIKRQRLLRSKVGQWLLKSKVDASYQDGAGGEVSENETSQSRSDVGCGTESRMESEGKGLVFIGESTSELGKKDNKCEQESKIQHTSQGSSTVGKFLTVEVKMSHLYCELFDEQSHQQPQQSQWQHPQQPQQQQLQPQSQQQLQQTQQSQQSQQLQPSCSFILPTMIVTFWLDQTDENEVTRRVEVKFCVKYQLDNDTEVDNLHEFGWYHDDLKLSFRCLVDEQSLLSGEKIINGEFMDAQVTHNQGQSSSASSEYGAAGGGKAIISGKLNVKRGSTQESDTSEGQIDNFQSLVLKGTDFGIWNHSIGNTMKFKAALRNDIPEAAMWNKSSRRRYESIFSTVEIQALGNLELVADAQFREHEFAAQKKLVKHQKVTRQPSTFQKLKGVVTSGSDVSFKALTKFQKIRRTFIFNHQFNSTDLEARKRSSPYTWVLGFGPIRKDCPVHEFLHEAKPHPQI